MKVTVPDGEAVDVPVAKTGCSVTVAVPNREGVEEVVSGTA